MESLDFFLAGRDYYNYLASITGRDYLFANRAVRKWNNRIEHAIIIQAKGTRCSDWTQVFKQSLELDGWGKNQVLSALEAMAIRNDNREARKLLKHEEYKHEPTKVVICIDGLEEDTLYAFSTPVGL